VTPSFENVSIECLWLAALAALLVGQHSALAQEARFALVIGNDKYRTASLATPANDAGLVADALGAAGFAVTGARNLDQAALRESFREFLGQVASAGPNAVAVIYLSGFGLQFEGENYFVPVDADIQRDVDVPLQAVRVSDFTQPLAALPGHVKIVVLDAARQNPFARGGRPLAGGLALVEPQPGLTIAFNAAPGTVGPDEPGALDDMFARIRLRVSAQTQGAEVPWYAARLDGPFFMTERTADAIRPPRTVTVLPQQHQGTLVPGGSPTAPGGRATVNVTLPAAVSHANQGTPPTPGGAGFAPALRNSPTTLAPTTPPTTTFTPPASTALLHPGGPGAANLPIQQTGVDFAAAWRTAAARPAVKHCNQTGTDQSTQRRTGRIECAEWRRWIECFRRDRQVTRHDAGRHVHQAVTRRAPGCASA
jgi:hypothetical protein